MTAEAKVTSLARIEPAAPTDFTLEQRRVLKASVAQGLSDAEFALFIEVCKRSKLDPFRKQIYALKRWTQEGDKVSHQTGIDGFRVIAQRSGEYEGQLGPEWCGPDGKWVDAWLSDKPPVAARVGVLRRGFREPLWAVARYGAYVQTKKGGGANGMWEKMPDNQLAKCAEALALRKAFPEDLSGLYTSEEMGQAGDATPPPRTVTSDGEVVDREAELEAFAKRMREVATREELVKLGREIAKSKLAKEARDGLQAVYVEEMKRVTAPKKGEPPPAPAREPGDDAEEDPDAAAAEAYFSSKGEP